MQTALMKEFFPVSFVGNSFSPQKKPRAHISDALPSASAAALSAKQILMWLIGQIIVNLRHLLEPSIS